MRVRINRGKSLSRGSRRQTLHKVSSAGLTVGWVTLFGALGATTVLAGAVSAMATYYARLVVIPNKRREDLQILDVDADDAGTIVTLPATTETTVPGTYAVLHGGGDSRVLVGDVVSLDGSTVSRRVVESQGTDIGQARRGWWSGDVFAGPDALGLDYDDVEVLTPAGPAPAWLIHPPKGASSSAAQTWVIAIHGRGARRTETLRAAPVIQSLGLTMLCVSYRNDGEAPDADGGRYGLGCTEWRDVDAAIAYALANGARRIVLMGWSMGGAVALQTADLSRFPDKIAALVLDAPVINWIDVLAWQSKQYRVPPTIGRLAQLLITHRIGRRLTGLVAPVDLQSLNWVDRADQLRTPTLIIHSRDDDFVPDGPSAELARRNPTNVDLVTFDRARHTKEWNVDAALFDESISTWLRRILSLEDQKSNALRN